MIKLYDGGVLSLKRHRDSGRYRKCTGSPLKGRSCAEHDGIQHLKCAQYFRQHEEPADQIRQADNLMISRLLVLSRQRVRQDLRNSRSLTYLPTATTVSAR